MRATHYLGPEASSGSLHCASCCSVRNVRVLGSLVVKIEDLEVRMHTQWGAKSVVQQTR